MNTDPNILKSQIQNAELLATKSEFYNMCDDGLDAWQSAVEVIRINSDNSSTIETDALIAACGIAYRIQQYSRQNLLTAKSIAVQDTIIKDSSEIFPDLTKNISEHSRTCGDYLVQNPTTNEQIEFDDSLMRLYIPADLKSRLSPISALAIETSVLLEIWSSGINFSKYNPSSYWA